MTFRGLFVTGTDTGVGKTVVTAALVAVLREHGLDAVPMKPVQTGCEPGPDGLVAPDLEFVLSRNGLAPTVSERALMCPCRFRDPCSPHLAARREQDRVSIDDIVRAATGLAERHDVIVVEGAGGLLVPLDEARTMADLAGAFGLPAVLVARPSLGTLNHTLLSLGELARRNLRVGGLVVNQSEPGPRGYVEQDNLETLARMGGVRVLADFPFRPGDGAGGPSADDIRRLAGVVRNPGAVVRLARGEEAS